MKRHNIELAIFIIAIITFLIYFICCFPLYVSLNSFGGSYEYMSIQYKFWKRVYSIFKNQEILYSYYNKYAFESGFIEKAQFVILGNAINMLYGFINYRKKWWYYIILIVTLFVSLLLLDCYLIYYEY
jgi:hypothetical protein